MHFQEKIDYLAIGHICYDKSPDGLVIGGAAAYASAVAKAAGCRTAVVTSSSVEDDWRQDLSGVEVHRIPSANTTIFENVYSPVGRIQTIHSVAGKIASKDIPAAWRRASVVHLAPIAMEVDPQMIHLFSNSLIGLAPQGWLRKWDDDGRVFAGSWPEAKDYLRLAAAVFISDEDLANRRMLDMYRQQSRLLVMTQGQDGCTLFMGGEAHHVPASPVEVVDTTGAGDIFAGAFLVRLLQTGGNPIEAARFANEIAALSITAVTLKAKIKTLLDYGIALGGASGVMK